MASDMTIPRPVTSENGFIIDVLSMTEGHLKVGALVRPGAIRLHFFFSSTARFLVKHGVVEGGFVFSLFSVWFHCFVVNFRVSAEWCAFWKV